MYTFLELYISRNFQTHRLTSRQLIIQEAVARCLAARESLIEVQKDTRYVKGTSENVKGCALWHSIDVILI